MDSYFTFSEDELNIGEIQFFLEKFEGTEYRNSMGIWVIEQGDDVNYGSKLIFKSEIRLKNLCTGKYLSVCLKDEKLAKEDIISEEDSDDDSEDVSF